MMLRVNYFIFYCIILSVYCEDLKMQEDVLTKNERKDEIPWYDQNSFISSPTDWWKKESDLKEKQKRIVDIMEKINEKIPYLPKRNIPFNNFKKDSNDNQYTEQSKMDLPYFRRSSENSNEMPNYHFRPRDSKTIPYFRRSESIPYFHRAIEDSDNIPYFKRSMEQSDDLPYFRRSTGESDNLPYFRRSSEEFDNLPYFRRSSEEFDNIPYFRRSSEESDKLPYFRRSLDESNRIPYFRRNANIALSRRSEILPYFRRSTKESENIPYFRRSSSLPYFRRSMQSSDVPYFFRDSNEDDKKESTAAEKKKASPTKRMWYMNRWGKEYGKSRVTSADDSNKQVQAVVGDVMKWLNQKKREEETKKRNAQENKKPNWIVNRWGDDNSTGKKDTTNVKTEKKSENSKEKEIKTTS